MSTVPFGQRLQAALVRRARVILVVCALAAVVGWTGTWHWLAELPVHFLYQYWLAGLIAMAVFYWARQQAWLGAALVFTGLLTFVVEPLGNLSHDITTSYRLPQLHVMQFNAAGGPDPVMAHLAASDRLPDLVVLLEATPAFAPGMEQLKERFPYQSAHLREGPFGLAVLSRFPFLDEAVLAPAGPEFPALRFTIWPKNWPRTLQFFAVHPPPPLGDRLATARNRYMVRLASLAASQSDHVIVIGDFNMTPWSPWHRRFTAVSGLRLCESSQGHVSTWPAATARWSDWFGIPIDGCLHGRDIEVAARYAGPSLGSDHLPVMTSLVPAATGGGRSITH